MLGPKRREGRKASATAESPGRGTVPVLEVEKDAQAQSVTAMAQMDQPAPRWMALVSRVRAALLRTVLSTVVSMACGFCRPWPSP